MKTKYAFIINSENQTPDTYWAEFKSDSFFAGFYAVNSMESACSTVKRLVEGGVGIVNLCGDFDAVGAAEIKNHVGESFNIAYVKYSGEQTVRLEALGDELDSYGIIIKADGFEPSIHNTILTSDEFTTSIICTSTFEQAREAAVRMEASGVKFIELCEAFGPGETARVIESVGEGLPVGSAGL